MHRSMKLLSIAFALALPIGCGDSTTGGTAPTDASATPDTVSNTDVVMSTDAPRTDAPAADVATDRPRTDASTGSCPVPATVTGTSNAAAMCTSDEMCGGPLACDTDLAGGFCWAECAESASAACEQAQCGGRGATCLSLGDGADATSFCTAACTPTARTGNPGSCRAGTVCTGWWYTHDQGEPDTTGCEYFCQTDAQCAGGVRCNTRTGECNDDPVVATRRADGEPCDPTVETGDPPQNTQCRGICFQETDDPHQGLCGSLVNLAATPACPDNPDHVHAIAPSDDNGRIDNLGLCIYREDCVTDSDCTSPLRCIPGTDGEPNYCGYDDGTLPPPDAGTPDAGPRDASTDVTPPTDATPPADVTPADVSPADVSPADVSPSDVTPVDAGPIDAAPADAAADAATGG